MLLYLWVKPWDQVQNRGSLRMCNSFMVMCKAVGVGGHRESMGVIGRALDPEVGDVKDQINHQFVRKQNKGVGKLMAR